jgi:membrane-bound serine protease (ClpP class)
LTAAVLLVGALLAGAPGASAAGPEKHVDVVQVSGWLDPVVVDFLGHALDEAAAGKAEVLVIQLDSPGSLVERARLDDLLTRLRSSKVPVAVWVGSSGARAYGGAAELVLNAGIAGMAPGARIGRVEARAAAPAEVRNDRTVGPAKAQELGLVQLDREESGVLGTFLAALDGKSANGVTLETATFQQQKKGPPQATLDVVGRLAKLDLGPRMLHTVASPPVAYLLLTAGLALLVFELFTGGIGIGGGVAAVCLALSGYGLAVLPIRGWALGLLLVGIFGFAVDVQTGVPRFWTAVGVLAYALGSLLLYRDPVELGWIPLIAGVVGLVLMMLAGLPSTVRSRFSTPTIGRESMIGETGEAIAELTPAGVVRVRGALWPARTNRSTPVAAGAAVTVVGIDGANLEVAPLD